MTHQFDTGGNSVDEKDTVAEVRENPRDINTATNRITVAQMAKWATAADAAGDEASYAEALLFLGHTVTAKAHISTARFGIRGLHAALMDAGAPQLQEDRESGPLFPPHPPTPDDRQLLSLLEKAQEITERIDARSGHILPENIALEPGETRGTDLAETISNLRKRLRATITTAVSPGIPLKAQPDR